MINVKACTTHSVGSLHEANSVDSLCTHAYIYHSEGYNEGISVERSISANPYVDLGGMSNTDTMLSSEIAHDFDERRGLVGQGVLRPPIGMVLPYTLGTRLLQFVRRQVLTYVITRNDLTWSFVTHPTVGDTLCSALDVVPARRAPEVNN